MSPIDPYLGAQAPTQDFLKAFLDREIPAGLLFYAPFWPQTGNQAWGADKRIVVPTTEVVDADGSYFAKDRLIRRANLNSLRMESLGGLIEGTRTNICLRSEQLDIDGLGAPWTHSNVSVTINAITAPDGITTAEKVVENNVNGLHGVYQTPGAANRTWSIFAKAGERTWIALALGGVGSGRYFDLANGVLGGTGAWPAPIDSGIERLPNGWYRCWIADNAAIQCFALLATGDGVSTYLGDGSSGAYFWGAQYETATFPSSYIPTVAAAVVRAAEDIQYTNAAEVHCAAAAGTVFVAITPEADTDDITAYGNILDMRVAGAVNGFVISQSPITNRLYFEVRSGGVSVANISSLAILTRRQTYIAACVWALNDFRFYLDGVIQGSDVLGAAPAAINANVYVGRSQGNLLANAHANLAHLAIFNRAMSAPEIEQRSHFLHNQMARAS